MVLQLTEPQLVVEDAYAHPAEAVENLRALLVAGAVATPDPHRKNFYEVQNGSKVYYVHRSPATGRVLLLGIWPARSRSELSTANAAD